MPRPPAHPSPPTAPQQPTARRTPLHHRGPRRWLQPLVGAGLAALLAATVVVISPGAAVASEESYLLSRVTNARASAGLPALAYRSDLTAVAQRHAAAMAAAGAIYHNGSLGSQVCCWRAIAENVGSGQNGEQIHNYLMGSASHRANILSSTYGEIGVGTARGKNGQLYVAEVFRQRVGTGVAGPVTSGSSGSSPRGSSYGAPAPAQPSPREILARRLDAAAEDLERPGDPVAAAYAFADVMALLTR